MRSRARLLGHSIHQMLIVFPLGLLGMAGIFDIVWLCLRRGKWADVSFWMIGAGIIAGLIAAVFGLIDWTAIPRHTRAKAIGLVHAGVMDVALILFAVSWWLRHDNPGDPPVAAIACSIAGLLVALLGGWFGGELVDRLAIGVDEGAHADAPNSLSNRPATDRVHPAT
jgi:uncharacterized membrane protein